MSAAPLRTARLFVTVGIAALVLGGVVIWQVVGAALRENGVTGAASSDVQRIVLATLFALGLVLLGVIFVAGRAYGQSLQALRGFVLARARGERDMPAPEFTVGELHELVNAVDRLSAHALSREALAVREGAETAVLLDAITEGILQLDRAGRVVRANPAARALLGVPDEVVGRPIATYIRHAELRRLVERAVAGAAIPAAEIAMDEHRVIVSAHPLTSTVAAGAGGTAVQGTVVAFMDLTEVRRLEGVRRDFVANVSHELKTPLTSIRGYVETLLADDELPDEMRHQFLQVVQKSADRLHDIIDDLLDLSRLESGGWRPESHEVNAVDVIEDVWQSCIERAGERNITFTPPSAPVAVIADPGGLRQVLTNLLDNALRYTPEGGRIEVRALPAQYNGNGNGAGNGNGRAADADAARGGVVVFEVRDTGTGIPTDALPRIFERFYRVDPARSRAAGGTGLGLAIVKHLVESMGGDVVAESELGKGTTIRFRLPAAP